MRTSRLRRACGGLILTLLLTVTATVLAQSTGGRITGAVTDPTGAIVPGVKVTLTSEATGVSRTNVTDAGGDYAFPEIPVGEYHLEFDGAGFKKNVRRGVTLQLSQVIVLNMIMQLGETREIVDVTSDTPLIETSSTQLGAVINERSIPNCHSTRAIPINSCPCSRACSPRLVPIFMLAAETRGVFPSMVVAVAPITLA